MSAVKLHTGRQRGSDMYVGYVTVEEDMYDIWKENIAKNMNT